VNELLDAGIDVFTTLNVQHLESRADTVRQITGAEIRETVPDSILDDAEIELVDLPPAELIGAFAIRAKVYLPERAASAAKIFSANPISPRCANWPCGWSPIMSAWTRRNFTARRPNAGAWKTGHRLLVAVSASPLSESLIRWTRRMADSLKCPGWPCTWKIPAAGRQLSVAAGKKSRAGPRARRGGD
jgi:two-component system, OmpR family, sensor histidine kinase KdpD